MTSTELRRIVGAMTERPWEANGRDVRCVKGLFAELVDVNHIGDSEQNAAAVVTLANHADALVTLVEACDGLDDAWVRGSDVSVMAERLRAVRLALAAVWAIKE